jgi:hypothetical protein
MLLKSSSRRSFSTSAAIARACLEALETRRLLSFSPAAGYAAGTGPQDVVSADFNSDGRLDLAVANPGSDSVNVMLGNANGTFQAAQTSATSVSPRSVAVGDFDGDGKLDLATANAYDVSVLKGNGNGTFAAPTNINIGSSPSSVAVGDFNDDGTLDLAVTSNTLTSYYYYYSTYESSATVLLGNGDGSFAEPNVTPLDYGYHTDATVADFNGDGIDDVATANSDYGYVDILLGDTGGFLQYSTVFTADYYSPEVAAGDVDGDGDADLVSAGGYYYNSVNVLLNDGAGAFTSAGRFGAGTQPYSIALGDFDRDGKLDIATANVGGNNVTILRGRGTGSFAPAETFAAGPGPYAIASGDFNGDTWLDLATANVNGNSASTNSVSVLLNDQTWPPAPASLTINDVSVVEGNSGSTTATFMVKREGSTAGTASVSYSTANAGALAGSDYVAKSGTLTFAAGVATMQVTIQINGDLSDEFDQSFYVNLTNPSGAVITDAQGVGTIVDNDEAPTVSITPKVSAKEGNGHQTASYNFVVTLSAPSEKDVWVYFATADGTATTADNDYVARSGNLYFAPGVTSRSVSVVVRSDSKKELNETFFLNLTSATNATLVDTQDQGIGEILNDDKR